MDSGLYEKAAVLLRYAFAAAGLFIALRCAYMCLKDGYKAAKLREGQSKYGAVASLRVLPADRRGKAQEIHIGRNGLVGSGPRSDVRIKGMGLKSRHFYYEIRASQMYISPIRAGSVSYLGRRSHEDSSGVLVLSPGDKILAGGASIGFTMLKPPRGQAIAASLKVYEPRTGKNGLFKAQPKPRGGRKPKKSARPRR